MWKEARDGRHGFKPRYDPVLVPTLERHRWIGKRSTTNMQELKTDLLII
jgi:hypothetical protein